MTTCPGRQAQAHPRGNRPFRGSDTPARRRLFQIGKAGLRRQRLRLALRLRRRQRPRPL